MKHLLFFCSLLFLVACSGGGKTNAQLKISGNFIFGGANLASYSDGGLMVWGQGPNGQAFGRALVGTDTLNLDLPNGTWTFYAMAWDKTTENFTGTARCAQSVSFLKGEPVTANLNLTNQNCAQAVFGGTIHGTTPNVTLAQTKFEWCGSEPGQVTDANHRCSDQPSVNTKASKGHGTSYRLRLRSYDRRPGAPAIFIPGEIVSQCFDGTGSPATPDNGEVAMTAPGLPTGLGNTTPFHISMEVFVGSIDCDTSASPNNRGFVPVELPHGLQSQQPRLKYVVDTTMAPAKHKLYVQISEADICNGREAQMPFAAGLGTAGRQYLICSGRQLQKMVTSPMTNHYKLLKDIDLNPLSKGALSAPTTAQEPFYSCLDLGGNFFPIGADLGTCAGDPPIDFSGSINGNGKKIRGLRLRLEDKDNIGLIASASNGGYVRNLILEKPEIGGRSNVGTIAGAAINNSSATFSNIEVIEPDVEGRENNGSCSNVGGLIGLVSSSNLQGISIRKGYVRSDCSPTGGIVGFTELSMSNFVSFSGIVEGRQQRTGGIFGTALQTNLSHARTEGFLLGDSYVGGITGWSDQSSYTNIYSHYGIKAYAQTMIHAGGLFGFKLGNTGTNTVHHAYAIGDISHHCSPLDGTCKLGEIVGGLSGSLSNADFPNTYYEDEGISFSYGPGVIGIPRTAAQFYAATSSDFPGLVSAGGAYGLLTGDLPRLSHEVSLHPCRLNNANTPVAAQISSGRGSTASNPILVCNPSQLADIATNLSRHFRLEGLVDGIEVTTPWGNFSGSLDGNNLAILGQKINIPSTSVAAWFSTVSGSIRNLSFLGGKLFTNAGGGNAGFIAKDLSGTLDGVDFIGTEWKSNKSGGAYVSQILAGGRILNSESNVSMQILAGGGYIGGLAEKNYGLIENVKLYNEIYADTGATLYAVGGIVSENYGLIRRLESSSRMRESPTSAGHYSALGVQINHPTGVIEDVLLDRARFEGSVSNAAYGMAYANAGMMRRIFSTAEVFLDDGAPRTISATIGSNSGTATSILFTEFARVLSPAPFDTYATPVPVSTNCQITFSTFAATTPWSIPLTSTPSNFVIEFDDGQVFRLASYTSAGVDTVVANTNDACAPINPSAQAVVHYAPLELIGTHTTAAEIASLSTFSSWNGQVDSAGRSTWIANMDSEVDQQRLVNIYLAYLSGQPLPEPPPTWEFKSGEGLRLFTLE